MRSSLAHVLHRNATGLNLSRSLALLCSCVLVWGVATAQGVTDLRPAVSHNLQTIQIDHPDEDIDLFGGALRFRHVDLEIPGNGGFALRIERTYKSRAEGYWTPPLGIYWSMHLGRVRTGFNLIGSSPCDPKWTSHIEFELPDGSVDVFHRPAINIGITSAPAFLSPRLWRIDCISSGYDNGYIVTSPDGVRYRADRVGTAPQSLRYWYPTTITDRNGNQFQITYTTGPSNTALINGVSSTDGRSVTFTYSPDFLLQTIVANDGRTWSYSYQQVVVSGNTYTSLAQVTRPDSTVWRYEYYSPGPCTLLSVCHASALRLKKITYPYGGSLNYEYDFTSFSGPGGIWSVPVLTMKTSSDGGQWTFSYAMSSQVGTNDTTTVLTPSGKVTAVHYGRQSVNSLECWKIGLPIQRTRGPVSAPALQTETFTWQSAHLSWDQPSGCSSVRRPYAESVNIARDATSYSTTYSSHDAYGNPLVVNEAGNASRQKDFTYYVDEAKWIINQLKDETLKTGAGATVGTISRSFDAKGNLISQNRYGVLTTLTRHLSGDVNTITNARNFTSTFTSYKYGTPELEVHPEGRTITRVVNSAGNVTSESDGEGHTTAYTYDALNRITGITPPINAPTAIAWASTTSSHFCGGAYSKTLTRSDYAEITCFDGFSRPAKEQRKDSSGSISIARTLMYDAAGRKTFASYPGSTSGTTYTYDALDRPLTTTHPGNVTRVYSYLSGNRVQVTNERGKIFTYTHRSFGNPDERSLTLIDTPVANADIAIERNLVDKITQVTQGAVTATYGYDARFFLTSATRPETGTTTFGRDAVGNMTLRQVGASPITPITTFAYDGLNRLTIIDYPGTTPDAQNTYDKNNKLTEVRSFLDAVTFNTRTYQYDANQSLTQETLAIDGGSGTVTYGYDTNDNLDAITYPSGLVVSYAPDALGRPTQALPHATSVSHHPSGQVSRIVYANGATTDLTFNARYWPETLVIRDAAGAALISSSYGYDGVGNLTGVTDTVDTNYNRTLAYDDLDRLITADSSAWGSGSMSYDGRGNLLTQNLGAAVSLTYSYDTANRLAGVSGTQSNTFTYDVYGNVVNNGAFAFTYDDASNLICANCTAPSKADYAYDGNRMRVKAVKNGGTTYSFYAANGNLLFETSSSAGPFTNYVYLGDKFITHIVPGGTTYIHSDLLGSPIVGTVPAGGVPARENYHPWGRQMLLGGATGNDLWFTGKHHDWDTKLSYFGARHYDVVLGRFMGVDPQDFDETNLHSFNRYAYANNNPYKFKDPNGQAAETLFIDVPSLILSYVAFKNDPSLLNGLGLAYDAVAAAVPGLPGGVGILRQAGKAAALGDKAARTFPRAKAFDKAGIETTEHFRKNLAQRGPRGVTEEKALDAYRNGRLYYDPDTGNYVRHSSRTGVSVVVEGSPTGGRAHSVFEGDASSRWVPVPWRPGQ